MTKEQSPALPGKQLPAETEDKPMRFAVEQLTNSRKYQKHPKKPETPES